MAIIDHEFDNIQRVEMSAEVSASVTAVLDRVRAQYKEFGFSPTAVDDLKLEITKHTLTLSEDEKARGVKHVFADGKPFYALNIATDTSLQWLVLDESQTPARGTDPQQKAWIAIDMMNLMSILEDYAAENLGAHTKDKGPAKPNGNFVIANYELLTRQPPVKIAQALQDVTKIRLDMMAQKFNPKPSTDAQGQAPQSPSAGNNNIFDIPNI